MDRLIMNDAQPVLDPTQEAVAVLEQLRDPARRDAQRGRRAQRARGARRAQCGMRVAVRELEVLRRELDIDDAAGTGLEVARAAQLPLDAAAHRGDPGRDLARVAG